MALLSPPLFLNPKLFSPKFQNPSFRTHSSLTLFRIYRRNGHRIRSIVTCQLCTDQTLTLDRSNLSLGEAFAEDELWAAACLRVRSFYACKKEESFGIQGFRKVDPDRWEFANEGFLRGQKHLLKSINRRKPASGHNNHQQPQGQSGSVGACVEVGKFGLEEEIERLKRDKNVLMQELVRLRQQQQTTDHQLHNMGQRLQGMEQRQQQMMSFLAKAMQSPGFLAQLVQQQNESNRRITSGVNKKRRLPRQENNSEEGCASSPDGQIIKYQPLMNEAAKAMLRQILKFDTPRLDTDTNPDFLIDDVPSPSSALDDGSSSNRISGVTLAEVPPTSGQSFLPVSSGFSAVHPAAAISEIQSSPSTVSNIVTTTQFPDASMTAGVQEGATNLNQPDMIMQEFSQMEGVPATSIGDIAGVANCVGPETENGLYMDPLLMGVDETVPIEADKFLLDPDMDLFTKLPGINDSFWEQFLTPGDISGDGDEIDSSSQENVVDKEDMKEQQEQQPKQENGWDKVQRMDKLTEQMGLLTSENQAG